MSKHDPIAVIKWVEYIRFNKDFAFQNIFRCLHKFLCSYAGNDRYKVTLQQLITYAQRTQLLCMNRTLEELLADWQMTWIFERAMQLLGESVKCLPRELCNRYPAVDWKAIAGMRDNITHGYDSIDYEILWKAVETQVPALLMTLNQMLNDLKNQ